MGLRPGVRRPVWHGFAVRLAAFMDAQPKTHSPTSERRRKMLEALSPREWRAIRAQAQRNAPSAEDAEDALQTGCVQFLRCYDGPPEAVLPWLLLVVKRCAWAIGRKEKVRATRCLASTDAYDAEEGEIVLPDAGTEVAEVVERQLEVERRIELIGRLKPDERTALILLGLGASYAEIGELRGWTQTKVNRCVAEGRAALWTMRMDS